MVTVAVMVIMAGSDDGDDADCSEWWCGGAASDGCGHVISAYA